MTTTELQPHNGHGMQIIESPAQAGRAALYPTTQDDMFRMAEAFAKSGMFGVKTLEQAFVVLVTGQDLGFTAPAAFRGIHVINGKPTLSADMMVAVCKSHPDICKYFRLVETTEERATFETWRVGEPEPVPITFTAADAKRAGLNSNPTHQKFPAQMLRARAASGLARAVYPDLLLGFYTPDEMQEVREEGGGEDYDLPQAAVTRDGTPRSERTPVQDRRPPINVTPPAAEASATPNPTDALKAERIEKSAALVSLLKTLPKEIVEGYRDGWKEKYGSPNPVMLDFAVMDSETARIQAEHFSVDKVEPAEAEEEDPFADPPKDLQPALQPAPASGPGHGD